MEKLITGIKGETQTVVTAAGTAVEVGSGSMPVLATPMLVALMEKAAVQALSGRLALDQTTVGTRVDIQHTAATPVGCTVRARAELTAIEGRLLKFTVQADDGFEEIGAGVHHRALVETERFMNKVGRKTKGA